MKHLFQLPGTHSKKCRYETMSWKSYYNLLQKRKWRLYGEKEEQEHERAQEQAVGTRVEQQGLVSEIEGEQRTTTKHTNSSGRKSNTQKKE